VCLVLGGTGLLDVGRELGDLVLEALLGFLLELLDVGLEVGLLPALLPFGIQGSRLGDERSVLCSFVLMGVWVGVCTLGHCH